MNYDLKSLHGYPGLTVVKGMGEVDAQKPADGRWGVASEWDCVGFRGVFHLQRDSIEIPW